MNPYIGHETQIRGVEEHRLIGGKGDGMRLYEINNGRGLKRRFVYESQIFKVLSNKKSDKSC